MTDTTPDYVKMIDLINVLACDEEHDAKETYDKSAEAIRTLLERIAALERERDQLLDKLHCMCGSPIDHGAWEGHTPVSVYDYSLDQERARAEAAEAKLAEAIKVLDAIDRVNRGLDWCDQDEQARRWFAARKFLKENGNGE